MELLPAPALRRGDSVELVCLSASLRILHRTSLVTNPAVSVMVRAAEVPRFRWVGGSPGEVGRWHASSGHCVFAELGDRTAGQGGGAGGSCEAEALAGRHDCRTTTAQATCWCMELRGLALVRGQSHKGQHDGN